MAEALYRKYRPQIFEDVVGQDHIERTLKNAIEQDKVSHAYLFTGPRGTGKTTTARLLAKALLCEQGPTPDPDGTCEECLEIANGTHPDVYELDAASRTGVENVREEIISRVQYAPTRGRSKIYIIDEVHMLSTAAFNALLKTLEEPPSHVVFILCTTDPQKVPETIHSRCQRFDFHRISTDEMVARLGAICEAEGVVFDGEALELVAHRADGGMRNALTSLEQLMAFSGNKVTMDIASRMLGALDTGGLAEIIGMVGRRDAAGAFRWTAEFVESGADLAQFSRDMAENIRNLYVMSLAGADVALDVSDTERREMEALLPLFGSDRLARLLSVMGDLLAELKTSTNARLTFEIALTRMVRPESDLTLEALAERVEELERSRGVMGTATPTAAAHTVPAIASAPAAPAESTPVANASVPAAGMQPPASSQPGQGVPVVSTPLSPAPVPAAAPVAVQPAMPSQPVSVRGGAAMVPGLVDVLRNPATLQRMWQNAMGMIKKANPAHAVLFFNTRPVLDAANGVLLIEMDAANAFAANALQKPEVQSELQQCLDAAAGAPVVFRLQKKEGAADGGFAPAPTPSPVPSVAASAATASAPAIEPPVPSAPASFAPGQSGASAAVPSVPVETPPWNQPPVPPVASSVSAPVAAQPVASPAPAPAAAAPSPVPAAAVAAPASSAAATVPSAAVLTPQQDADDGEEASTDELNSILAGAFGEGVVFTEE